MGADRDPRPLPDEPLALDLLNTELRKSGANIDLLASDEGLSAWLAATGLATTAPGGATVGNDLRNPLVEARAAIRAVVSDPDNDTGRDRLNQILDHGRLRVALGADGQMRYRAEVDDPADAPAFAAAHNLVELLESRPDRIRSCEHPDCILWFFDTSRNGTRRWCSMTRCGNRAKARRHYSRAHGRDR